MKTLFAAILLLIVAATVSAQDAKRVDAIWAAANERMSSQIDTWFEDGEFPLSIQLLRFQNDLYPSDYEIATNLGWMLENVEEWDEALVTYQRYRAKNPKDPDARLPEAEYWYRKREFAKVIPLLENKIAPKAHANQYRILAHAYERTGRLKESERTWKAYLALSPNDLTAKKNLDRVVQKLKGE